MLGTRSLSDFRMFGFWNICTDFTGQASLTQKSETANIPKPESFRE
jgi:hypothetical protein